MKPFFNALPLALLGALFLTACDAAGDASDADLADADVEAVATVASALALETGGVLDDAAFALGGDAYAQAKGPGHGGHGHQPGDRAGACEASSVYGEATGVLTRTVTCERERGPFSHTSSRVIAARFVDADGAPVPGPDGAVSVSFDVLEGVSQSTSPRGTRAVTETTGGGTIVDLDTDEVTVDAQGSRTGGYDVALRGGARRQADYTVTLALDSVTGPPLRGLDGVTYLRRWRRATGGTASGTYSAEVTTTSAGGVVRTRTVERTFEVTFPAAGDPVVRMDGRDRTVDLGTGAVAS